VIAAVLACALATVAVAAEGPRPLADGDRVVFLGDAFFERDHDHGLIEATLTARMPGKAVSFRNLGWSGDSVFGHARAAFETAAEGFDRRAALAMELRPTVVVVAYGMGESFDGEAGLPAFAAGLGRMLDSLGPAGSRVVLLTPIAHEDLGPPLPDPSSHNAALGAYAKAIADVARRRGLGVVDLNGRGVAAGRPSTAEAALTDNGIHLNAQGSMRAARIVADAIAPDPAPDWRLAIDGDRAVVAVGVAVEAIERTEGGLRFRATDARLPDPVAPGSAPAPRTLTIAGLAPGRYALAANGKPLATATAEQWAAGVELAEGPWAVAAEALRRAVVAKNRTYFHRQRPQNETYLYGFRKHEQGNNAAEVPLFDPLVAEQEAAIAALNRPQPIDYTLTRADDEDARR